jgi:hypothetical protein
MGDRALVDGGRAHRSVRSDDLATISVFLDLSMWAPVKKGNGTGAAL